MIFMCDIKNKNDAIEYAYGNQTADISHIAKILNCDVYDAHNKMNEFGLDICNICGAFENIDEGEYIDSDFICEDCIGIEQ